MSVDGLPNDQVLFATGKPYAPFERLRRMAPVMARIRLAASASENGGTTIGADGARLSRSGDESSNC